MEQNQKYWLLRIEQTIYGPFDTQKVVDLITKGRVSEIDEAALPRDRWHFVRDLQEFMRAVELQRKINSRKRAHEETKGSGTATEAIESEFDNEHTKELTSLDNGTRTLPTPEISREELLAIGDSERARPLLSESSGLMKDKFSMDRKTLSIVAGLLVLVIGLAFLFKGALFSFVSNGGVVLNSDDALDSWNDGEFARAYEIFKTKKNLQEQHPVKYAALILKNTQDYALVKTWLDKASINEKETNAWVNLNAMVYLYENNMQESESFLKSIDQSKGELSLESLYNLAVWHHKQGDWSQSRALFESIFAQKKDGKLDSSVLYLADAWLQSLIESSAASEEYLKLASFINNVRSSESLYKYDISFLAFWMVQNSKVGPDTFGNLEADFLSYDPQVVFDRLGSAFTYDFFGSRIKNYCVTLVSLSKYIQLSCQMTSQRTSLNSVVLSEAPVSDSSLLALYSFIYDKKDDSFKANEFLIESFEQLENSRQPLKLYVQARFCQVNGNYKCAVENWEKALELNQFSPTAMIGLSEALMDLEKTDRAQSLFYKATPFSKNLVSYQKLSHRIKGLNKKG